MISIKLMIDDLLRKFSQARVLVIGDVMIDAYLKGNVGRISPEAPVPIVDVTERYYRPGGAANVAINLSALDAKPLLCSVIGNDEKGRDFADLMVEHQLDTTYLLRSDQRKTTVKYRILANSRQVLRVDEEDTTPLNESDASNLLKTIRHIIDNEEVGAIVFEDYDKGVISPDVIAQVVTWANQKNLIVTVDPKKRNFIHYQNVTMFKPNLKELREGLEENNAELNLEQIEQRMRQFAQKQNIRYLFTTMSENGVALYDHATNEFYTQPAYLRRISDVSGAGDTVISVATLCLLSGVPAAQSAQIANLAGGIVCEYSGVTPVPLDRLADEIRKYEILTNI